MTSNAVVTTTHASRTTARVRWTTPLAQQFFAPVLVVQFERRVRWTALVDVVVVSAIAVALVDERLQIQGCVRIRFPQRHTDDG